MILSSNNKNNIDHYQFIYQRFAIYKKNKYLNKETDKTEVNIEENQFEIKQDNNIELKLGKARQLSKYELEDINEFVQRKNFPERNKFKCFESIQNFIKGSRRKEN